MVVLQIQQVTSASISPCIIALKTGEVICNAPLRVNVRLGSTFECQAIQQQRRLEQGLSDAFVGAINNQDRSLAMHKGPRAPKRALGRACTKTARAIRPVNADISKTPIEREIEATETMLGIFTDVKSVQITAETRFQVTQQNIDPATPRQLIGVTTTGEHFSVATVCCNDRAAASNPTQHHRAATRQVLPCTASPCL